MNIHKQPTTLQKLHLLSQDSQYDLSCACGSNDKERRHRSGDDRWVYPAALPGSGEKRFLFKTLISNVCSNDCKYCPIRSERDVPRCSLRPEEVASVFMDYYTRKKVMGIFLSSGVIGTPDSTMDRITAIARILRKKHKFKGYMHLKIIPGASDGAIEEAVSLAGMVSINIETPGENHFRLLSGRKDYFNDVIRPLKYISKLTGKGMKYSRVKQTTQFVVGAADETDRDIVRYAGGLYNKLKLNRIYFSAYQRGAGTADLPGEHSLQSNADLLTREHRLYQTDFLMRKYRFAPEDIPLDRQGYLALDIDPKEHWARCHPEFFPINLNRANKYDLLRVPGIGHITVNTILSMRKEGRRIRRLEDIGRVGKRLEKARGYLCV
ncbi:MAG: radical SAM protein [Chitinivibrionales bacterium]|nr:radical SAM protein [Chitinivibrionales bacterium]